MEVKKRENTNQLLFVTRRVNIKKFFLAMAEMVKLCETKWTDYFFSVSLREKFNDITIVEELIALMENAVEKWPDVYVQRSLTIARDQLRWAHDQEEFRGFPYVRYEVLRSALQDLCFALQRKREEDVLLSIVVLLERRPRVVYSEWEKITDAFKEKI